MVGVFRHTWTSRVEERTVSYWVRVVDVADFPVGGVREYIVDGYVIAMFRVGDVFHALDGICPHQGGPLGKGRLDGCIVTCPWHGWQFDVRTGQHQVNASLRHTSYPVRIDANVVYVEVPS